MVVARTRRHTAALASLPNCKAGPLSDPWVKTAPSAMRGWQLATAGGSGGVGARRSGRWWGWEAGQRPQPGCHEAELAPGLGGVLEPCGGAGGDRFAGGGGGWVGQRARGSWSARLCWRARLAAKQGCCLSRGSRQPPQLWEGGGSPQQEAGWEPGLIAAGGGGDRQQEVVAHRGGRGGCVHALTWALAGSTSPASQEVELQCEFRKQFNPVTTTAILWRSVFYTDFSV